MSREQLQAAIAAKEAELKALDKQMGEMWRERVRLIDELEELRRQLQEADKPDES